MNIAIYMRDAFPSVKNEKYSKAILQQRNSILNYINKNESMQGIHVFEYVDAGVSGLHFQRPELNRLLMDIAEKRIDVVIVRDLERFSRNAIEGQKYIEHNYRKNGVMFMTAQGDYEKVLDMHKTFRVNTSEKEL